MITDPKVGDVVYLDPNNHAGWRSYYKAGELYEIISTVPYLGNFACRCRCITTGELVPKGKISGNGTWACYLIRDEFLTAARKAQKGSKRAPRATKETTA